MNTWPFPVQSAGDLLSTSRHQGHSIFGSLESADLHPGDEGEGDARCGGGTLLLAILCLVDHRDFHVGSLSMLSQPLLSSLLSVGYTCACEKKFYINFVTIYLPAASQM